MGYGTVSSRGYRSCYDKIVKLVMGLTYELLAKLGNFYGIYPVLDETQKTTKM